VAWGKQDKLVDVRLAPRTARAIPDSRLMIVDGVGHTAQLESPRILARAVLSLLDEYSAAATSDRDAGPLAPAGHEEAF
jgi:pimeloyl-ACP methyl ester carboxylesterase